MASVEFDTPANRIIAASQPKNKFRIDTSLPDIAFFRQLSVQGRLRYFQTNISTASLVITPQTGETFFFYRAYFTNQSSTANASAVITNNGQVRYTNRMARMVADWATVPLTAEFIDSLVGDNTKQFVISASSGSVLASVFGWVENTSRIRDVTS